MKSIFGRKVFVCLELILIVATFLLIVSPSIYAKSPDVIIEKTGSKLDNVVGHYKTVYDTNALTVNGKDIVTTSRTLEQIIHEDDNEAKEIKIHLSDSDHEEVIVYEDIGEIRSVVGSDMGFYLDGVPLVYGQEWTVEGNRIRIVVDHLSDRTILINATGEIAFTFDFSLDGTNGTDLNAFGNFELQFNPSITFRSDETNGLQNLTVISSATPTNNMTLRHNFTSTENVTFYKNGTVLNDTNDITGNQTGDIFSVINTTYNASTDNSTAFNWSLINDFILFNVTVEEKSTHNVTFNFTFPDITNGTLTLRLQGLLPLTSWRHTNGTDFIEDISVLSNGLLNLANIESGRHELIHRTNLAGQQADLRVKFDNIWNFVFRIILVIIILVIVLEVMIPFIMNQIKDLGKGITK